MNNFSQGADTIKQFNKNVHKIIFENYDKKKIIQTLDSQGNDFVIFQEDNDESSLTINAYNESSTLKLNKLKNTPSKWRVQNLSSMTPATFRLVKVNFTDVKVSGLRDLKSTLKKSDTQMRPDPIDLSDVLTHSNTLLGLKN